MFETLAVATIPEDDEALRGKVRSFIASRMQGVPVDRRARSWMGAEPAFSRALGQHGLLGLSIPTEYGGQGRGPFARFVVIEELLASGAPVAAHWIADRQSAPLILRYGTESRRQKHLPAICRGESYFCIGMSEPGSGSDLASIRTRASPLADGRWLLNGQKIWTTGATICDHMIALVRTSGTTGDRQAGLSQVIIDLRAKGVTIRPITDLTGDAHFAEVFFEDVELSADALLGEEGGGWQQVTAELALERSGPERIYSSIALLDGWVRHLQATGRSEQNARLVGRFTAELACLRAMSLACTARLALGESPVAEASIVKDRGTSFEQELPLAIGEDLAAHPYEPVDGELYRTLFYLTHIAPSFSLRGGTREILRGIIARAMGLR